MISVFTRRQDPLRRRQTEAGADDRCRCSAAAAGDSSRRFARAHALTDRWGRSPTTNRLVRATGLLFRYGGGNCTSFERSTCDVTIGIKSAAANAVVNRRNTTLAGGRANRSILSHQWQWQQQPSPPRISAGPIHGRAEMRRVHTAGSAALTLASSTQWPRGFRPVLRRFSELTT